MVAQPDFTAIDPGILAAAASALAFALTAILTKRLTRIEGVISILFWLALMQLILGLAFSLADGAMHWPTLATAPWLAVVGAAGILGHLCQELLALFLGSCACCCSALGCLVLQFLIECFQCLAGLFQADCRLGAG